MNIRQAAAIASLACAFLAAPAGRAALFNVAALNHDSSATNRLWEE